METLEFLASEAPILSSLAVFVLGAAIGSFLNVCIIRVPAGRSIVSPGSTCVCGRPVRWHDNLPILGWLFLRGKARCCGAGLSPQYPLVELLTGSLFVGFWLMRGPEVALAGWVFASFMIAVAVVDWKTMEIPDAFSVGSALAGLVLVFLLPGVHAGPETAGVSWVARAFASLGSGLIGMLIGAGLVFWLKTLAESVLGREAMGEGDIVLLGAIGVYTGWEGTLFALFGGAVIGTVLVLAMALAGKLLPRGTASAVPAEVLPEALAGNRAGREDALLSGAPEPSSGEPQGTSAREAESFMGREVPFGPLLAAAGVLDLLWLHPWVEAYFDLAREALAGMLR